MAYTFNPIKEDKEGIIAKRQIWSTESVNKAFKGISQGRDLIANPFYEKNTKLLKGDLNFYRTDEEIEEYKRCMNDIIYFCKYCKLMTPEGIKNITLRDYQYEYLKHLQNNRLSIFLSCRQSGKTTTSAIFMLWYILFNTDKNSLVLGNKRKTAVEILDKIKKIFLELPFFLKPGIKKWNEGEIVLDNGCRCMCEATTINSGISFTFHCILADEFAHIQPNILDKFYNNLFPTVTAAKARFMITSTQNGYNLFYRLYNAAETGDNDYAPYKVDWWQVPEWNPEKCCWEKRDEEWHKRQIANYGGEEEFNKQFGTNFDSNSSTLINSKIIKDKQSHSVKYIKQDLPGVLYNDKWFWKPDIDVTQYLQKGNFLITCDLAEGIGNDSTIFNVIEIVFDGINYIYETIGYFKSNNISLEMAEKSLRDFCSNYMVDGKYLISVEYNTYGELFYRYVMNDLNENYTQINMNNYNESSFIKYENANKKNDFVPGIKINSKNKIIACSSFKRLFENNKYKCNSIEFMQELQNFSDVKGNGSYEACFGHDDLIMSSVQLTLALESIAMKNFLSDIQFRFSYEFNNKSNMFGQLGNYGGTIYDF